MLQLNPEFAIYCYNFNFYSKKNPCVLLHILLTKDSSMLRNYLPHNQVMIKEKFFFQFYHF